MFPQRSLLRAPARFSPSTIRQPLQRRLASSAGSKLAGPEDNAFNRERLAVKAHAAATASMPCIPLIAFWEISSQYSQIFGAN